MLSASVRRRSSKVGVLQAEDDRALEEVVDDEYGGDRQADGGSTEPRKILTARCI